MSEIENKYNSRYTESIIYKLNQNPTEFIEMDSTLKDMLEESIKISEITNGKYDITIGPILDLWGFNDLSRTTLPKEEEIIEKLKLVNYRDIQIENNKVKLKKIGERIDTGSFLKGYAIKKGKDYLVNFEDLIKNNIIKKLDEDEYKNAKENNKSFLAQDMFGNDYFINDYKELEKQYIEEARIVTVGPRAIAIKAQMDAVAKEIKNAQSAPEYQNLLAEKNKLEEELGVNILVRTNSIAKLLFTSKSLL